MDEEQKHEILAAQEAETAAAHEAKQAELFPTIGDEVEDDAENGEALEGAPTCIQSMCMACGENGETRLLLTLIPNFREVIVMAFQCEECGYKNSEVQFGGELQRQGVRYELRVEDASDLNRQIIKSDSATITIPEAQLEIPPGTQKGVINTVEGLLSHTVRDLRADQDERATIDPETTARIGEVLTQLTMMAHGITLGFTCIVDDPAGNSYIENPNAPAADPSLTVTHYTRTAEQDLAIGLQPSEGERATGQLATGPRRVEPPRNESLDGLVQDSIQFDSSSELGRKEVVKLPTECYACGRPGDMNMCSTDVPHFKEVLIMAFQCEHCGFKSNEIKGGGAITSYGEVLTLHVTGTNPRDMSRDVLKSDSAGLEIPELELWMEPGSLGGLYTTVEGLLQHVVKSLERANPFAAGDSTTEHHGSQNTRLADFLVRLDALRAGDTPFSLVIKDPLANSFIMSDFDDLNDDPALSVEQYTRSAEEDADLGIADMVVTNYAHLGTPIEEEDEEDNSGRDSDASESKGDAEDEDEIVLPDRLTHVHPLAATSARVHCRNCHGTGVDFVKENGYCEVCARTLGLLAPGEEYHRSFPPPPARS